MLTESDKYTNEELDMLIDSYEITTIGIKSALTLKPISSEPESKSIMEKSKKVWWRIKKY